MKQYQAVSRYKTHEQKPERLQYKLYLGEQAKKRSRTFQSNGLCGQLLKIRRRVPMMLKGLSFRRVLLIVLWGAEVCLGANREGRGDASLAAKKYDGKAAQTLAFSVLEECENGFCGIHKCLLDFVRSRSLKMWLGEAAKGFKEWKDVLEKFAGIKKNRRYGSNPSERFPTLLELNSYFERAYDLCIGSFRGALSELRCYVKSEDFFSDLKSLRKSIEWDQNGIAEHYHGYIDRALEVSILAQAMKKDFLKRRGESPRWRSLVDRREEILAKSSGRRFMKLILENRQEINTLILNDLAENDEERWEALVKSVRPVLKYEPLTTSGSVDSFDGFDDLVVYVAGYAKERHAADFWKSAEVLFERDLDFSRALNRKMDLMLLENALNREGIRIAKADDDAGFYN